MRIAAWVILLAAVALALAARRRTAVAPDQSPVTESSLASVFHASDPRRTEQLLVGFYEPDAGGRWTQSRFSVMLGVPNRVDDPVLYLRVFIPDVEIQQLKSLTLAATAAGSA